MRSRRVNADSSEILDSPINLSAGNHVFRPTTAPHGFGLADIFRDLEHSPAAKQVSRHGRRELFSALIPLTSNEGSGHWELTRIGSNVFIVVGDNSYHQCQSMRVPGEDRLLTFSFRLAGEINARIDTGRHFRSIHPAFVLWHQPRDVSVTQWIPAGCRGRGIAISVDYHYLFDEFFSSVADIPPVINRLLNGDSSHVHYCQRALTSRMHELTANLLNERSTGALGLIHKEVLTFELLCLAISSLHRVQLEPDPYQQCSARDLKNLQAARSIIIQSLSEPPTISQLARKVGTNQTDLKRGFKALYGETVFDFSTRHRMEHAYNLLCENQMPVGQVAQAVGYTHQTSFASAFRRHFGMAPSDARLGDSVQGALLD
jgi:AraC-like DNA-binding protein